MEGLGKSTEKLEFGKVLTGIASVGMSVTRLVTSISSAVDAFKNLSNPDMSGSKKVMAIFTALIGVISAVASIYTVLTTTVVGGSKTMAQAIYEIPGIGWILAIVAALGILIGVFISLKAATPEEKLKDTQRASEELNVALKEAKDSAEELHDSFDNYNDAVDALARCRKGTKEWQEALEGVNDQVLDILSKFPEFLEMEGLLNNDNGNLTLDPAKMEELLNSADQ
jgi:uncharacterized membrane protein